MQVHFIAKLIIANFHIICLQLAGKHCNTSYQSFNHFRYLDQLHL